MDWIKLGIQIGMIILTGSALYWGVHYRLKGVEDKTAENCQQLSSHDEDISEIKSLISDRVREVESLISDRVSEVEHRLDEKIMKGNNIMEKKLNQIEKILIKIATTLKIDAADKLLEED